MSRMGTVLTCPKGMHRFVTGGEVGSKDNWLTHVCMTNGGDWVCNVYIYEIFWLQSFFTVLTVYHMPYCLLILKPPRVVDYICVTISNNKLVLWPFLQDNPSKAIQVACIRSIKTNVTHCSMLSYCTHICRGFVVNVCIILLLNRCSDT